MWILSVLPDSLIHTLVFLGVIGILLGLLSSFLPIIQKYVTPILIGSILLTAFGSFLEGALVENKIWKAKVKDLEIKLIQAEVKASKTNTEIITKVITKKQVIKEKADKIDNYIEREVKMYDNSCVMPESLIKAHDASALQIEIPDAIELPLTKK